MNGGAVKRRNRVLREQASVVARAWMEQVWRASFGTRLRVAWVMVRGGPREFRRGDVLTQMNADVRGLGKEGRKTENGKGRAGR